MYDQQNHSLLFIHTAAGMSVWAPPLIDSLMSMFLTLLHGPKMWFESELNPALEPGLIQTKDGGQRATWHDG